MWIARDKDGTLSLYGDKPVIEKYCDYYSTCLDYYLPLDKELFPEVTFENSPQEVELKLIKK